MHKSTARSEQFFGRTGNESTKGSRKGYSILGGGEDVVAHLTPEQQRNNLQTRLKWLVAVRAASGLTNAEKTELHHIQKALNKLRPVLNSRKPRDIPQFFLDVCRERLSPVQFKLIMDEAAERSLKHEGNIKLAQKTE